jgi:hypothetical protein
MRFIALIVFSLMTIAPASAQYANLRPRGAVHMLDGCNGMSGYCCNDRYGYNCHKYGYGYSCRKYGYGCNCAYYQLPDWNGAMEIRNPGG